MNIDLLRLNGFTRHKDTLLRFPEKGVVLVTGANGSGKSSILEGVSYGLYGKTLRGSDPWPVDTKVGLLEVAIGDTHVSRVRDRKKMQLTFRHKGKTEQFETLTKAQDALTRVIPSFDGWRRSSVFSSQDTSSFSRATDAERKRLLEEVLGLDRFDKALDRAKEDVLKHRAALQQARQRSDHARVLIRNADEEIRRHKIALLAAGPDEDSYNKALALANKYEPIEAKALTDRVQAEKRAEKARFFLDNAKAEVETLLKSVVCPTCNQPLKGAAKAKVEERKAELEKVVAHSEQQLAEWLGVAKSQEHIRKQCAPLLEKASAVVTDWHAAERTRHYARECVAAAEKKKAEGTYQLKLAEAEIKKAGKAEALADECIKVLGIKGLRAHLLTTALDALVVGANAWLSQISYGCTIALELGGPKADRIDLKVSGIGAGGYDGASGGERRRIDVALMLALADLSAGSRGETPGTLFFDEVLDTLDREGVTAVSEAIHTLAEDRCVVVISHSEDLVTQLRPTTHWRVENGAVI